MASKLSGTSSIIEKTKMSLQNSWKLLSRYGSGNSGISEYNRNLQIVMSKEWMELFKKVTYAQIESMRKFSVAKNLSERSRDEESKIEKTQSTEKAVAVAVPAENEKEKIEEPPKPKEVNSPVVEQSIRDQIYAFPQVLSALLPQFNSTKNNKDSLIPGAVDLKHTTIPKWKMNIPTSISKHSITSRTRHVLNSIATAESAASRWRRVEDLLAHIEQYPEARHHAIKEGAIAVLLKARTKTKDPQITGSIREALAVMGHVDPLPGRGIRILTIDGGGIRGLVVLEMLKKLEQLTGQKVHEMFDYMCGVSTGAILSATLGGLKRKSLDEISELYKALSTKIFTRGTIRGASNLVWSHSYYDTELWEQMLQEHLGDKDLIKTARDPNSPKFAAVSAVINHAPIMVYIFRNYTLPYRVESQYMGSHRHKVWEAVRASAAAPTYFGEFKQGDYLFTDGGLMVNNPCAVAIHEAKQLWPNTPIQCVVSFGTGRIPTVIGDSGNDVGESTIGWKEKFHKILASATDTEAVHTMLNDLLPDHVYYRFNPYLTEMLSMEEIRPEKIMQLEGDAMMYIRKNEAKFRHAAAALTQKRSPTQKLADWCILNKKLMGL
ncbi:calcium-independent phospholipase A2-gamma-like isoform X2 [Venturia canescens]|nr:calcium-independent phospholipase A2-gamma-like isoform X2 [Venturia canescens]